MGEVVPDDGTWRISADEGVAPLSPGGYVLEIKADPGQGFRWTPFTT
ncbi:hypothetical protein [Nocardiopsis aegyptia]|uniref:Uncharacterized protein n=1 Tax=Nocardiopsis aegyptia TaxID=220378 RepID=A0A7Z0EK01_9ACTN|nr:hypothetical protein [Nocardiopsis aegyptia]NYJ33372.1 hypothetical protein [Nocardiopsis aegyptia]